MLIRFLLICEGTSDRGLLPHLEALCVRAGANEAMGDAPDFSRMPTPPGKASEDRTAVALQHGGDIDLVFVHEDADTRDTEEIRERIRDRLGRIKGCPPHVCIIPVREMEAWLLADEDRIRLVAGNPNGKHNLELPHLRRMEAVADPKKLLKAVLATASGEKGARLEKLKARFPELRGRLLQLLDIDGPVNKLPAWQRLVDDVNATVSKLLHP